ncbi:MAG: hypothetical protein K0M63_09575 [Weeksellaceae bacterium]|nr:hypothetical protein [Weeksellaceae bacterium]
MTHTGKQNRATRAGLEREVNLLRERLAHNGMVQLQKELQKIRMAPNGRLDLNTVSDAVIAGAKPVRLRNSA